MMRTYKVYFEIFGKKMSTNVLAKDEEMAKRVIENRIVYHKIERQLERPTIDVNNIFDSFFKM